MLQQAAGGLLADAFYFAQLGRAVADLPALAMKRHGEAVRLIANLLHQVQHR